MTESALLDEMYFSCVYAHAQVHLYIVYVCMYWFLVQNSFLTVESLKELKRQWLNNPFGCF